MSPMLVAPTPRRIENMQLLKDETFINEKQECNELSQICLANGMSAVRAYLRKEGINDIMNHPKLVKKTVKSLKALTGPNEPKLLDICFHWILIQYTRHEPKLMNTPTEAFRLAIEFHTMYGIRKSENSLRKITEMMENILAWNEMAAHLSASSLSISLVFYMFNTGRVGSLIHLLRQEYTQDASEDGLCEWKHTAFLYLKVATFTSDFEFKSIILNSGLFTDEERYFAGDFHRNAASYRIYEILTQPIASSVLHRSLGESLLEKYFNYACVTRTEGPLRVFFDKLPKKHQKAFYKRALTWRKNIALRFIYSNDCDMIERLGKEHRLDDKKNDS